MNKINSHYQIRQLILSILVVFYSVSIFSKDGFSFQRHDPILHRDSLEKSQHDNPFTISFHEPTFILPINHSSRYSSIYTTGIPDQRKLVRNEFLFQFSLKTPIVVDIFKRENALYLAYTQTSFWQAYHKSPFLRANNYQPEVYFANHLNTVLPGNINLQFVNIGFIHQSNGKGGVLERSWNRAYIETILTKGNFVLTFRPWYIIPDDSLKSHNPNLGDYMGHFRVLFIYKYHNQTYSWTLYNLEHGVKRTSSILTWSFPLTKKIRGYVRWFSGYGQNLLEYDSHVNSIGFGISLSDWA